MATARVTANTVAQTLFTTPRHQKGVIDSIVVANATGAKRVIRLQDVITTNDAIVASTGAAYTGAVQGAIYRYQIESAATSTTSISKDELGDTKCFGVASIIADAIDTDVVIIVSFHFE